MNKVVMDKILKRIIKEVAAENGTTIEETEKVFRSPFKFIKHTTSQFDAKTESIEDLSNKKTDFSIPRIMKLRLNLKKLKYLKDYNDKIKKEHGQN